MPKNHRSGQAALLTSTDWIKLKRHARGWFKVFLYIAYLTGERWGAIRQLQRSDVYGFDGQVNDWITFRRNTRKGKDRTRQVPVHPDLNTVLQGWKPPAGVWLFPAPRNSQQPVSLRTCDAALRRLLEQAHLGHKGISGHSTRTTFVTKMHDAGVALHTIQQCTGHRSLQNLNRYIQSDPQRVAAAVNVLSA